jgi:hypothetical protein
MSAFDRAAIVSHLDLVHRLARESGHAGKLVLAVYGENPDTGESFKNVDHFDIGEVNPMTAAAMTYENVPHANVYMPLAIMGPDLPTFLKGGEKDIVAVLGAVIDGDADKGKAPPAPPVPADYVLESSPGNKQHFLLFDRALVPAEAKPLFQALQRATQADCADDMSHVWRVPGCLNWPTRSKLKRGRSSNPQLATVLQPWNCARLTNVDELRRMLAPHWEAPRAERITPDETFYTCSIKAEQFLTRLRDVGYYAAGPEARTRYTRAAKALSHALPDEVGQDIWQRIVCWQGERDDEGEAVTAEELETRWRDCSKGVRNGRPITFGSLVEEAKRLYGWTGIYLGRGKTTEEMFGEAAGDTPGMPPPEPTRPTLPHAALDDFIAYLPMHQYLYTATRALWPQISVNSQIPPVPLLDQDGKPIFKEDGKTPKTITATTWLDRHRAAQAMSWVPGEPLEIHERILVQEGGWVNAPGSTTLNLYRRPTLRPRDGDEMPWRNHVGWLFGTEDAWHIIDWLAHRVQRPQDKVNHALVFGGAQGIGKDTVLEPIKRAIGPWNFGEITPKVMLERFNEYAKSIILRISETRDLGDVDRYNFYEHTKVYCAGPPDAIRINEKHVKEYTIPNVVGVVLTIRIAYTCRPMTAATLSLGRR